VGHSGWLALRTRTDTPACIRCWVRLMFEVSRHVGRSRITALGRRGREEPRLGRTLTPFSEPVACAPPSVRRRGPDAGRDVDSRPAGLSAPVRSGQRQVDIRTARSRPGVPPPGVTTDWSLVGGRYGCRLDGSVNEAALIREGRPVVLVAFADTGDFR